MASPNTTQAVDRAETMRREGRVREGLEAVEQVLMVAPNHSRALLLRSRLLYELGSLPQAAEALRDLKWIVSERDLQPLVTALERFRYESRRSPAFATESMAKLLAHQGYFLEALEVYRQLFDGASNKSELWDEIVRLEATVEQEGSREATRDRVEQEIETWQLWLQEHRRGR